MSEVDAGRLASADTDDWLEPAERARIVDLIDDARRVWAVDRSARAVLDRLAPGARYPARIVADRFHVVRLTERMVVAYRRSLAGYQYAIESGRDVAGVTAEFGLGHVSRPSQDDEYWLATRRIE